MEEEKAKKSENRSHILTLLAVWPEKKHLDFCGEEYAIILSFARREQ